MIIMKYWDATAAKRNFSQVLSNSGESPQIVEKHGKPVSVVISFEEFERTEKLRRKKTVSVWLAELADINNREEDMDEIVRSDRKQPDWE